MNILITGAAGFIGYHLSKFLLENSYQVIAIDNLNNYYDVTLKQSRLKELGISDISLSSNSAILSNKYSKYTFIKGDITESAFIESVFNQYTPDIVCHLAAQAGVRYSLENPRAYAETNLTGFFNVLDAARAHKVKHFVYASSSSVYGLNEKFPLVESDPVDHPVSLYAATKRSNELMAHAYSHLYQLPTTGLRFFTVYVPWGRPDMALIKFTKSIYEGTEISLYNQGNMMRDFTYIDDVVTALFKIVTNPFQSRHPSERLATQPDSSTAPFEIYNIGNASPVKMLDYIKALEDEIGKKANIQLLPNELCELTTTWADSSKLSKFYNLQPGTTLSVGIKHFVNWYKQYYKVG
jgi:UDP-glucuronate 4-epimerase